MIKSIARDRLIHTLSLGRAPSQVAESESARTLLSLGQSIFELEEAIKRSPRGQFEIEISASQLTEEQTNRLSKILERLISFVIMSDTRIAFTPAKAAHQTATIGLNTNVDAVCLFSGGVDSISGALLAAQALESVSAVFCAHRHQGRVISITRRLGETYLHRAGVPLYEVAAPSMQATGYSQTRGWLYILSAAATAVWLNSKRVLVGECGPTMYQPKFGPSDQTTMTTHPFLLERAQEVIELIAPGLRIVTPFADMTKAEVMAVCPNPRAFRRSHSCVSQRLQLHDGTCYGCVVRRLAALASNSPDVEYNHDPFTEANAKAGNLLALLDFSVRFLDHPRSLPSYQHDIIHGYKKGNLFKRFALDNIAALHRLKGQGAELTPSIERIYVEGVRAAGGERRIDDRLQYLASMRENPPVLKLSPRSNRR